MLHGWIHLKKREAQLSEGIEKDNTRRPFDFIVNIDVSVYFYDVHIHVDKVCRSHRVARPPVVCPQMSCARRLRRRNQYYLLLLLLNICIVKLFRRYTITVLNTN